MKRWLANNTTALAICLLAAIVATTGGVAIAATGQLVNIADGTTASQLAKVDALGRLLVAEPALPGDAAPWQQTVTVAVPSGSSFGTANYVAPADKRIVVEFASGVLNTTNANQVRLSVKNGSDRVVIKPITAGTVGAVGPTPMTFHLPKGSTLTVTVYHPAGSAGSTSYNYITLSGTAYPA